MYSASKEISELSANIKVPSTVTSFRGFGEEISTIMVCPFSITIESPFLGIDYPPQVAGSLQSLP